MEYGIGTGRTVDGPNVSDKYPLPVTMVTPGTGGANSTPNGAANPLYVAPSVVSPAMTQTTVGTTSTQLRPANASRRYLAIQNTGTAAVTLNIGGATAVVGQGWILNPATTAGLAGGNLIFENNGVPTGAITAISGTAGQVVTVLEG